MPGRLHSRPARLVGVLALLVLLAGCSVGVGGGGSEADGGDEPQHVSEVLGEDAEDAEDSEDSADSDLVAALLTEGDLPYGFTATDDTSLETGDALCEAGGQTLDISTVDDAATAFASEADELVVMHAIERYEPGDAARELEAVRQEAAACNGQTAPDGTPLAVDPIMFPTLGDDTAAFRITYAPQDGVEMTMDMVAFQTGDLVSYVGGAGPCACPPDLLIQLGGIAEERADELAGLPA